MLPAGSRVSRIVGLGALWLICSGKFDALHLFFGACSVALVAAVTGRLGSGRSGEQTGPGEAVRPLAALAYVGWLVREIVVANLEIARVILRPSLPIDPVFVRFRTCLPGPLAQVALGNSITLTPGTLTLAIVDGEVLVHALTGAAGTGPVIDAMQRRLARVFRVPGPVPRIEIRAARSLAAAGVGGGA